MNATPETPPNANGANGHANGAHVGELLAEGVELPATEPAPALELAPEPPTPAPKKYAVEFPDDLESLAQVLMYDDDANGGRPVRMACLDVRDLGGGLVVVVGKVMQPTRVRRLPDGAIVEVPGKSMIAVPIVSDLIQIPYEMASKPDGVFEAWFWPLPEKQEIAPGRVIQRYAVKGGWLEGMTKKDLLAA